jgi:sulfate adenylyltransferase subunit 1
VVSITDRLDIHSLQSLPATALAANEIGRVRLSFQQALITLPYQRSRALGSMVLVDTASHKTSAAVMVQD